MQLLEIALVDETIKDVDISHVSSMNLLIDSLKSITFRSENVELQDHIECMVQGIHLFPFHTHFFLQNLVARSPKAVFFIMLWKGSSCSKEKKPVDRLFMTLASEWTLHDNMNSWTIGRSSHDFNKLVPLLQHWAVVHLGCIQRLVSYCLSQIENLDKCEEKIDGINLRKRLSFCTRVFKLLSSVTKDAPIC